MNNNEIERATPRNGPTTGSSRFSSCSPRCPAWHCSIRRCSASPGCSAAAPTRILHPFIGVAMFVFFLWLAIRFAGHNRIEARDRQWLRQINDVVHNREEKLPEVGRYNAGQKVLFWVLILSMLVLLLSGIVIWREYFSSFFGIVSLRWASLLHAAAAFVLIVSIIVHIYAAIWIKVRWARCSTAPSAAPGAQAPSGLVPGDQPAQ